MFPVRDVYKQAQKILAVGCSEQDVFQGIEQALELLANKALFRELVAEATLCTADRCVVLPSDVDAVLSVNTANAPLTGRSWVFETHVNGPGLRTEALAHAWVEQLTSPVFVQPCKPTRLFATCSHPSDAARKFIVHGFTPSGSPVRSALTPGGPVEDGFRVPLAFGVSEAGPNDPYFSSISAIYREPGAGTITLYAADWSLNGSQELVTVDARDEVPAFRRLALGREAPWVRVRYRKKLPKVESQDTVLPIGSMNALLMALRAVRAYSNGDISLAIGYETTALRLAEERNIATTPKTVRMPQFADMNHIAQRGDRLE